MSKKKAIKQADKIFKEHNLSIPIDFKKFKDLFEKLGVKLKFVDLENNISGSIVFNKDNTVVLINKNHPETRQRFTLAHELAHFLMHKNSEPFLIDPSEVKWRKENAHPKDFFQEVEANVFAANLLMPEIEITKYINENHLYWLDDRDVSKMAVYFKVSPSAMRVRLTALGIIEPEFS